MSGGRKVEQQTSHSGAVLLYVGEHLCVVGS